jgi:hypothetical protein
MKKAKVKRRKEKKNYVLTSQNKHKGKGTSSK